MCVPANEPRPCLDCNGSGRLGLTAMECQTCRGRGILMPMTMDEGGSREWDAAE